MKAELLNILMHDGSRHFGDLPLTVGWYKLGKHVKRLPGVKITDFLTDYVTEAWMDFSYRGYSFSINDPFGSYWFFVKEPECPDEILEAVLSHCQLVLTDEALGTVVNTFPSNR